ncbi:ArsR family transcriptional regulator [Natrarchaeobius chitinivorans]|uniref:ArsR family transcriptional regulator n=1 Tax=Natrarchaeobius chitinivorans TaxID=1679083 RepID=A0A3N6MJ53_NATCH|nr:ArsR family transcriptional regulator [Natrarchaeobius chitinivorans]
MRRPRVDWMTRADDSILEFLLNEGNQPIVANPSTVEANIDYKISHVRRRLRELQRQGLLEYYDEDRGLYRISEKGRSYLEGELEAADLERDE